MPHLRGELQSTRILHHAPPPRGESLTAAALPRNQHAIVLTVLQRMTGQNELPTAVSRGLRGIQIGLLPMRKISHQMQRGRVRCPVAIDPCAVRSAMQAKVLMSLSEIDE